MADNALKIGSRDVLNLSKIINVVDVGARGGLASIIPCWGKEVDFKPYNSFFKSLGLEPDLESAKKLNYDILETVGAGAENGKANLYLTKGRALSSVLKPDIEAIAKASPLRNFERYDVEEIQEIDLETIDSICERNDFRCDILKIDVQGSELDVLVGAKESLKNASVVLTELSSVAQYVGQKPSWDVIQFLSEFNLDLAYVDCKPNSSREYDVVFFRNTIDLSSFSQVMSVIVIAELLGRCEISDFQLKYTLKKFCNPEELQFIHDELISLR